mmetsp:Transcript_80440/g.172140  ORF Transcript_80440/g.172140 Transcript_80440/m.172140 type:complete len:310 (-) Transcript_80440:35-964(-)
MYIGAWQEYKLAKLIQQQNQRDQPPGRGSRASSRPRSSRQGDTGDDAASVASSSASRLSGFSTQSAPAQLSQASTSAQSRLNNYYDQVERSSKPERSGRPPSGNGRPGGGIPRPRSSAGSRGGAGPRGSSSAPRKAGSSVPKKAKPPSLEEQRRTRILQMQRLYGLAGSDEASQQEDAEAPSPLPEPSAPAGLTRTGSRGSLLEDTRPHAPADYALGLSQQLPYQLNSSSSTAALVPTSAASPAPVMAQHQASGDDEAACSAWSLPPLPEDPFAMDLDSSGGLIAWSKNLRPDELSPQATLASFFQGPS